MRDLRLRGAALPVRARRALQRADVSGGRGSIGEEPRPCLYLPFAQNYQSTAILFLHTEGDPATVTAAARQAVSASDQDMPVYDLKTMNTRLSGIALLFVRVGAALVVVFGLLGLAVVGLYGVISHSVIQPFASPSCIIKLQLLEDNYFGGNR